MPIDTSYPQSSAIGVNAQNAQNSPNIQNTYKNKHLRNENSVSQTNNKSGDLSSKKGEDKDFMLKLLLEQLRHQGPDNEIKPGEALMVISQQHTVRVMQDLADKITSILPENTHSQKQLYAINVIGKNVNYKISDVSIQYQLGMKSDITLPYIVESIDKDSDIVSFTDVNVNLTTRDGKLVNRIVKNSVTTGSSQTLNIPMDKLPYGTYFISISVKESDAKNLIVYFKDVNGVGVVKTSDVDQDQLIMNDGAVVPISMVIGYSADESKKITDTIDANSSVGIDQRNNAIAHAKYEEIANMVKNIENNKNKSADVSTNNNIGNNERANVLDQGDKNNNSNNSNVSFNKSNTSINQSGEISNSNNSNSQINTLSDNSVIKDTGAFINATEPLHRQLRLLTKP